MENKKQEILQNPNKIRNPTENQKEEILQKTKGNINGKFNKLGNPIETEDRRRRKQERVNWQQQWLQTNSGQLLQEASLTPI